MFNINNEDQVNNNDNNIFLSDVVTSYVLDDEELTDNMKLHIITRDM